MTSTTSALTLFFRLSLSLSSTAENLVPPADAWPDLIVLRLGVAEGVKLRLRKTRDELARFRAER